MKVKILSKLLIIILTAALALPMLAFTAEAAAAIDAYKLPPSDILEMVGERTPTVQSMHHELAHTSKVKEEVKKAETDIKKKDEDPEKKKLENAAKAIEAIRQSIPGIVNAIKDAEDGGDFDTAAALDGALSGVSSILALCGPYGEVFSAVVNLEATILKLAMGGEASTSEIAGVEDRLSQQMDEIQNQLYDIEEQIGGLSDEINESANKIINEVTSAIDNADAKAYLRTFMLSGEGNFSYNQYRNLIYGSAEDNSMASTAYYSLLKQSIARGASEETVKYYYDRLYHSITEGMDAYYDYIIGTGTGKSIIRCYYDVVSANPALVGTGAITETLKFASDLYDTELRASKMLLSCNLYQYAAMYRDGKDSYCYDESSGKIITKVDIEGAKGVDSMQERLVLRAEEIRDAIACDIAYILETNESYVVKTEDGTIFESVLYDEENFGNLLPNMTVFLPMIPEEICREFGIDVNDYSYRVSVPTGIDGSFVTDEHDSSIRAALTYKGEELSSISFLVGASGNFLGGNGTAQSPYLVGSPAQLLKIGEALDKHYRLVCDIDFNNSEINPIGFKLNGGSSAVFEEFTGTLDGNGYTVKNLSIIGGLYTGLFASVGEGGEIADLSLYNVKAKAELSNLGKSVSEIYAGLLAGKNNGIIKYCQIKSNAETEKLKLVSEESETEEQEVPLYGLYLNINNETLNRSIYAYAGGIVGVNNKLIMCSSVEDNRISASSTHNFRGEKNSTNRNNVYVGGISGVNYGKIAYVSVSEGVKLLSYAKSIYNPSTNVSPYITVLAGGICAESASLGDIYLVEAKAKIVQNEAVIECKSNWGAKYNNHKEDKNDYIPGYDDNELESVKAANIADEYINKTSNIYNISFEYDSKATGDHTDFIYDAGAGSFVTEDLKVLINGKAAEYELYGIYGFDSLNESFSSVGRELTILFSAEVDGQTLYFAEGLSAVVRENSVKSIELIGLKEAYLKDSFSLSGLTIKYSYAVGEDKYIILEGEALAKASFTGDISNFGEQTLTVLYEGDEIEATIRIICDHGTAFTDPISGYIYKEELSREASCSAIGYDAYLCTTCGDVKYFYLRRTEHIPNYSEAVGAMPASCTEEGYTGRVLCSVCSEVILEGQTIPKLNHHYIYLNEDKHICESGSHSEYHQFTVTESVEKKQNADGSEAWCVVYIYECICSNNGERYKKETVDENSLLTENSSLPTIMINDAYVLSGGEETVVYVQLINNPGINGANFGIRYSEGLELVNIQDGSILRGSLVTDGKSVNYGYNFVWGNDSSFSGDGNLLKLTFRVNDYAKLGDSYGISLVYAVGNGAQGGFATNSGKQYFITKGGSITVVERLPGDVNNDGSVDLLDAALIGRFVVGKSDHIDEAFANVDLSYDSSLTTNVDVMDIVAILRYITGGYGTNLLAKDFNITLNTNGYDNELTELPVSVYGENNTYLAAGLTELDREGYKFLGWYDKLVGGNRIELTDIIKYNPGQKKQTLYAHWELNKLVFDTDGATSGDIGDIVYSDGELTVPDNEVEKKYNIIFVSKKLGKTEAGILSYELLGWQGSNGRLYSDFSEIIEELRYGHIGNLRLIAVWSETPELSYPDWRVDGYEEEILWYKDTELLTGLITPGVNDYDIIAGNAGASEFKVYAKHTSIVYDIEFVTGVISGVDGRVENIPSIAYSHSVDNPFKLGNCTIIKTGYEFVGWTDNYGNEYEKTQDIGYIAGASQGDKITLTAHWGSKTYTISFVTNDKYGADEKKYSIETLSMLSLPELEYSSYPAYNNFCGWYFDKDCTDGERFNIERLRSDPKNITLYAKWNLCEVYYITNTPSTITGNRVIIDWSSVEDGTDYNANRTIYTENVSELYIVGNEYARYENLVLSFYAGTADHSNLKLHLDSFHMEGKLCKRENSAGLNVTIECEGRNSVSASYGEVAISGCSLLTVKGTGLLQVFGYRGSNGASGGKSGENGGNAIVVDRVQVDITGEFAVYGGHGGYGHYGYDGIRNGAAGGNGGNGGVALICNQLTVSDGAVISLRGGYGGNGGYGGAGQQGRLGLKNDSNMHDGYTGGAGGHGGHGGNAVNCPEVILNSSSYSIVGGDGGNGGDGGAGGKGGPDVGTYYVDTPYGRNGGDGGAGGNGGNSGTGITKGNAGNGGLGGAGGKATKETWGAFQQFTQYGNNGKSGTAGLAGQIL